MSQINRTYYWVSDYRNSDDHGHCHFSEYSDVLYETRELAEKAKDEASAAELTAAEVRHMAETTRRIEGWEIRRAEHDALYRAGLRPNPFSETKPEYVPFDQTRHRCWFQVEDIDLCFFVEDE